MHRIEPLLKSSASSAPTIESALFSSSTGDTTSALFAPMHYEPKYTYPLIVWLHGQGADERQLMRIMPMVSMRNYVAVAPRGSCSEKMGSHGKTGYDWNQTAEVIHQAQQRVSDCIAQAERKFRISRQRVFLAGFDTGGTMAFRVAMNCPNRFAGVLSFCGPFPSGQTPLGRLTEARKLPVFLAVGRDSQEYPATEVCANLRLFHTAGLSTTLRQYPFGHELGPQMLADMDRWIIEQVTASKMPTEDWDDC